MLSGDGNENGNRKLPSYTFYGGSVCVPVNFFFHCHSFSPWWPLAFLSTAYKIFMFFFQRKLVSFFISDSSYFPVILVNVDIKI